MPDPDDNLPCPADEQPSIGVIADNDEVTFYPPAADPEPPTVH